MNLDHLNTALLRANFTTQQRADVIRIVRELNKKPARVARADDWGALTFPLKAQIKSLQSSQKRWRQDLYRMPVYDVYLKVLLKIRDRIDQAEHLNFVGKSIREIGAEKGLTNDGARWTDWAPQHVRDTVQAAFEKLYHVTLPNAVLSGALPAIGKHIVPFSTVIERTVSSKRWDIIRRQCREGMSTHSGIPEYEVLYNAFAQAMAVVRQDSEATPVVEAPINWRHLLTPDARARLAAWEKEVPLTASPVDIMSTNPRSLARKRQREARKLRLMGGEP